MTATEVTDNVEVRHNPDESRYELLEGDRVLGIAEYRVLDDVTLMFPHTQIATPMQGQGLGVKLVAGALDDVRRTGRHVVPRCWFVAEFIDHHPEYRDLIAA